MEEALKNGWIVFITFIDWVFVASFFVTAWFVNRAINKSKIFPKLNIEIRTLYVVIVWCFIWGVFFYFNEAFRPVYLKEHVAELPYITILIFSFFAALAIHEIIPFSQIFDWLTGIRKVQKIIDTENKLKKLKNGNNN